MKNYWTIDKDGFAQVHYFFPVSGGAKDLEIIKIIMQILEIGNRSQVMVLSSNEGQPCVNDFILSLKALKKTNQYGLYPRILFDGIYNYSSDEQVNDYYFSSNLFFLDKGNNIVERNVHKGNIENVLKEIGHPLHGSFSLCPMSFSSYYSMHKDEGIKSIDFTFCFHSDLWSSEVPCPHCPKNYTNELLRKMGGLSAVRNFWMDNSTLANLNVKRLNAFMSEMFELVESVKGEIVIDAYAMYEKSLTEKGIITEESDRVKLI